MGGATETMTGLKPEDVLRRIRAECEAPGLERSQAVAGLEEVDPGFWRISRRGSGAGTFVGIAVSVTDRVEAGYTHLMKFTADACVAGTDPPGSLVCLAVSGPDRTQGHTPKEALGFDLGDDYQVANYTQLDAYWKNSPPSPIA